MKPHAPWSYVDPIPNRRGVLALAELVVDAAPELDDRPRLAFWALGRFVRGEGTRDDLRSAWLDLEDFCLALPPPASVAPDPLHLATRAVLAALHAAIVRGTPHSVELATQLEGRCVEVLVSQGEDESAARARALEVARAAIERAPTPQP